MNELAHLAEFQALLGNQNKKYVPSAESQKIVQQASIGLFAGPTNAGRNTIIDKLVQTGRYYFVISDTTRSPKLRNGRREQDGVNYWFRSEMEVLADIRAGKFVEAAIIHEQQVSGMSVREIAKAYEQGKTAVTDIEMRGVENVRAINPQAMALFVLPPSFDEWQARLQQRGDLGADGVELGNRLRSSVKEFQEALQKPYFWFVINDDLDEAVRYTDQILTEKKADPAVQQAGHKLSEELLAITTTYLQSKGN